MEQGVGTGWSLRSFPPKPVCDSTAQTGNAPHKQVRVNENEELSCKSGVGIPKKERTKSGPEDREWEGAQHLFISPSLSHAKVVPINYIRQERNACSEPDSSHTNTAPKAVCEIILLPLFAGNMENIKMLHFNCLKSR